MTNSIQTWLLIIFVIALVCLACWRWNKVNECTIANEQYNEYSQILLEDLFGKASKENEQIPIKSIYWQSYQLSKRQLVYLCRLMQGNGLVKTPDNWGFMDIIFDLPPESLALTKKSMSLMIFNKRKLNQNISITHNNAPINIQGQQTIISGQTLSNDNLCQLAKALRTDAPNLSKDDASTADETADLLQDVATGQVSENSPEVAQALKWVQDRISEAIGSAAGSALWAGTIAAAKALGWII